MMPNTALGLLASGAALWLLHPRSAAPRQRSGGRVLAAAVSLLGLLVLAEYIFAIDLGIDLLLFPETVQDIARHLPGRPSPITALSFLLLGLALLLLEVELRWGIRPAQLLGLAVAFISLQALVGYLYLEERLFTPSRLISALPLFTPMAVHTALTFLLLSFGLLAARPERGLIGVILGDDVGGVMARRLLPAAILVPILVGGARLLGERLGLYGVTFGVSITVIIIIVGFLAMVGWNASALHRIEATRQRTEQALRLSEARLSGIVSNAADAIILVDEEQRITLVNGGAERIFGYAASELLGQPMERLLPERLRAVHRRHFQDFATSPVVARQMGERRPIYGQRRNGEEFMAEASISKLEVEGRRSFTVIMRDISERIRAQEAFRESQERFRAAYENAPIGMALVGRDGRFLTVNRALCQIVGFTEEELLTRTFQDITHPDDLEEDLANVRRLLEGAIHSYQIEKRYFHKRGQLVTTLLAVSLVRDSRGEPLYFISQVQDISERKRLEQAWRFLAETGWRLSDSLDPKRTLVSVARLAVPALADWCVIELVDDERRVEAVEAVATDLDKEQILRELFTASPHDPTRHGHFTARVLRTGEPELLPEVSEAMLEATAEDARHLELLHRLEPRSGMVVPLVARGRTVGAIILVAAESGRRYGAHELTLAGELARRAALAVDNAGLYRKSEQATRVRDEVLQIVAHDLRTPLHVISLSVGALQKRQPEVSASCGKQLATIQRAVERANRLIQDLLDVARMEAGGLTVERRPMEVGPLIQEVFEHHQSLMEAKSLQWTSWVPEDSPALLVDHDRVLQVFSNLLGNAIKFTPEGGQLVLRAERMGDWMRFSVSDTGPGIPAAQLPHLFEPFWQARAGREGAGLGLAIARGLVEAHGGRLWIESSPGVGSTFSFTLPLLLEMERHSAHDA